MKVSQREDVGAEGCPQALVEIDIDVDEKPRNMTSNAIICDASPKPSVERP